MKIFNQMQPDFNQRQFDSWAKKHLHKASVNVTSSALKSTGMPGPISKSAAHSLITPDSHSNVNHSNFGTNDTGTSVSITAGGAAAYPGSSYGASVKTTRNIGTGQTKTKMKIEHSKGHRVYIQGTGEVRIGNGISLHASAEAEAKNGKPGASGSAGIKMQW